MKILCEADPTLSKKMEQPIAKGYMSKMDLAKALSEQIFEIIKYKGNNTQSSDNRGGVDNTKDSVHELNTTEEVKKSNKNFATIELQSLEFGQQEQALCVHYLENRNLNKGNYLSVLQKYFSVEGLQPKFLQVYNGWHNDTKRLAQLIHQQNVKTRLKYLLMSSMC